MEVLLYLDKEAHFDTSSRLLRKRGRNRGEQNGDVGYDYINVIVMVYFIIFRYSCQTMISYK